MTRHEPPELEALRKAVDAAQEALFDIYLHEGPAYGDGVSVRPGGTIRERINAANLAIQELRRLVR